MSLFFYCIMAVLIAFVIGRANRNITLFWTLLIAFGIGAIGAAIIKKCTTSDEKKSNVVTVLTPTDGVPATILFTNAVEQNMLPAPTAIAIAPLVSQVTVSDHNILLSSCTSKASGEPRGQPFLEGYFNTS